MIENLQKVSANQTRLGLCSMPNYPRGVIPILKVVPGLTGREQKGIT